MTSCRTIQLPVGLAILLILMTGCSKEDRGSTPAVKGGPPVALREEKGPADFAALLPRVGGPAGYLGSESCRSCHEEQFNSWHRSYHRTMTQFATPDSVRANFHNVTLTNDGIRFVLSQTNDEFRVRMASLEAGPPTPGDAGETETFETRISLITGSHHMQVFWVPGGDGNTQIGFPFTWLIPEARWVPRHSTFVRPPDAAHQAEIWNISCSRCHTTAIEPRVDLATHTMDTRVAELGVSCEACHGPGRRHVEARNADGGRRSSPSAQILRSEIVHPKKIDPVRASQVCGFCHSMKWFDQSENWRQGGFSFRPGDDLERSTPIIRAAQTNRPAGLTAVLARNPDILRDFFWPDGMVRVSGREYNGLIESPCHQGGKFSCLSCHSLHESDPDDQLARNRTGNEACTQCHEPYRDEARLTAHTGHRANSSGSECYNCHMPFTTYGVLKAIRSHQVSSPRVADQLATGRPNACNLCHLDKSLAWTAAHLAQRRGGEPAPGLSAIETNLADSVRLALSGDAGQRVLLAWHFGWEPALKVSGKSWGVPVLAELLDDPYAAVRCVAERSLTRVAPSLVPAGYDFTISPELRKPVGPSVVDEWKKSFEGATNAAAELSSIERVSHGLGEPTRKRNDARIRLRE